MSGIYIHIPFCKQACHYCDFHFSTQLNKKEPLLAALHKEIALRAATWPEDKIETVYFGGGTPSLLSTDEIEAILEKIQQHFNLVPTPEITLEANPDDLSEAQILAWSKTAVNRLSIGIQSFTEADLKLMNRAHTATEAKACLTTIRDHFENISIDLIYGIPGVGSAQWDATIDTALSFDTPHISAYALTVEPKTALHRFIEKGIVAPVDDEQAQKQFYQLCDRLEQAGFVNYEISNFGKPGYFSKNNCAYWQGKPYLGLGPSAHSFDGNSRSWSVRNNSKYIAAITNGKLPLDTETLSTTDRYNEYLMTGLRTIWGVSLTRIEQYFGPQYRKHLEQQMKKYIQEGLLDYKEDVLLTTPKGKFLVDGIASNLFMLNLKQ